MTIDLTITNFDILPELNSVNLTITPIFSGVIGILEIVGGDGIDIDNTNPKKPIVSSPLTTQQVADKIDLFEVSTPTEEDYLILGGEKKTLISELKLLFKTFNDSLYPNITHSHAYSSITDKPAIPSKTSDLTNDSNFITNSDLPTFGDIISHNASEFQTSLGFTPEQSGVAAQLVSDLKNGVSTNGDTLKKLYDLIVSAFTEITVSNITERDAYNISKLPTNVFVNDDGDGTWALYKATNTGTNANYVKISDPDLLNAVMTGNQIATAYEGVNDVNRFTNALKTKLDAFTANFTLELKAAYDDASTKKHTHDNKAALDAVTNTNTGDNAQNTLYQGLIVDNDTTPITSTGTITPNFSKKIRIYSDTTTGPYAATIGNYSNIPSISGYNVVRIFNNSINTVTYTIATSNQTIGSIVYSFQFMNSNIQDVQAGKYLEISYEFIYMSATSCTVSIVSIVS